ncbi:MAG: tRNA-U20-dihydrouridine synthase [Ignavibacteria bacterium]|nr:MAG: tRNA-U20-dihydrouridine synthase [Ignavibacteria bacterium]KAF0161458.1 MAG: tRNA-U20-dihydrouridine synthase [Ignavibacteria bacterium]
MKIGNLDIGQKLFLAPMAEVTDSSFRKACKEQGAGVTFTQMVSAEGIIKNNFESLRILSFNRNEKPIGVQILGNDPAIIGEAVREISRLKPDLIDLNCGCSVDKVTSCNMGSALLDDPEHIGKITRKMVDNAGDIPISVKLRLGKDRSHINIFDTAKAVEDSGGSLVVIHARARNDKYISEPEWNWIAKVKERLKIPVVGNGSIFSPQDVKRMFKETGCDSVMVARGALGNPFIFSRYQKLIETGDDPGTPDIETVQEILIKHINNLELDLGEVVALDRAKKQTVWYLKDYPGINLLLENVFRVRNFDSLRYLIIEHVSKIQQGVLGEDDKVDVINKFKKKVLFWLTDD